MGLMVQRNTKETLGLSHRMFCSGEQDINQGHYLHFKNTTMLAEQSQYTNTVFLEVTEMNLYQINRERSYWISSPWKTTVHILKKQRGCLNLTHCLIHLFHLSSIHLALLMATQTSHPTHIPLFYSHSLHLLCRLTLFQISHSFIPSPSLGMIRTFKALLFCPTFHWLSLNESNGAVPMTCTPVP